jgi:hypothetical protein
MKRGAKPQGSNIYNNRKIMYTSTAKQNVMPDEKLKRWTTFDV